VHDRKKSSTRREHQPDIPTFPDISVLDLIVTLLMLAAISTEKVPFQF
jgi:hypothetical protein